MTRINGKVICGTRGGKSFEQVDRPDLESNSCPEGTTKCSNLTSAENSVCYPVEQHETHCPITYMKIVDAATGDSFNSNDSYVVLDFQEDDPLQRYLVYSKNQTNNLPLTTAMIDRQPCLTPSETSSRSKFFVTELDRAQTCTDESGEFVYDPRFSEVGNPISEFDLQEEYGIIQSLEKLHYHERSIDYGQKTQDVLKLWIRPTINWKLEGRCGKIQP